MADTSTTKTQKKRRERTEISVSVGKAIAERRKLVHLTQQKLAEALGLEKETVSRLETGEIAQTVDRLEALSKVLHCSVVDFFVEERLDTNKYITSIDRLISPLSANRKERVVRCVAEIVGAWEGE